MSKPVPWSHSALEGFLQCSRQYIEIRVLKHYQDKKNEASLWGDRFHKMAEQFIGYYYTWGTADKLPPEMLPYAAYLAQFLGRPGKTFVEQEMGLDMKLKPTHWLGPDVWMRGVIDVLSVDGAVAQVDDHKTGKNRKVDMQQLIIFAILVFYHYPEVQTVHTAFHWVQYGFDETAKDRRTFTRDQLPAMWETLLPKLQKYRDAFAIGVFPPNPSGLCKAHCAVESCEFHGKGRR